MRSISNKITSIFKQKDIGDNTSGSKYKNSGHLWCRGVRYQPRDVNALVIGEYYGRKRIETLEEHLKSIEIDIGDIVAFCMRCFKNSAVPVDKDTNFCHYCGSGGTCISIKRDEAEYLRTNIIGVLYKEKESIK